MNVDPIVSNFSPICLVGGAHIGVSAIHDLANLVETYVAVDSGADHLLAAGIMPSAIIGDLDSLSDHARHVCNDKLYHIDEQDTTDFEKALGCVSAPVLICLGFTGGRLDHTLSVLNVMARFVDRPVILADENDVSFLACRGKTFFDLPKGTRVSVMPIGPAKVSLDGVDWSFKDQAMDLSGFTSPSNAATGGQVSVTTDAAVLVTLPRAQLQTALTTVVRGQ